jgi:hypothetical protein
MANTMMTTLPWSRAEDFPEGVVEPGPGMLDPAPLLGTWINTNPQVRGIARIVLAANGGRFTVQIFGANGANGDSPIDWGEVPAVPFAHDAGSRETMAFSAAYDLGFQRVELQANVKQGVLVVASFNEFTDGSGRSSYFTREFFYR